MKANKTTGIKKFVGKWIAGLALLVGIGFGALTASAGVSLKNGNFFVGYSDIVYPGQFETKIERVYNSKSSTAFKGMFGWGWGNEYEVNLTVSADGSVVVYEYGGGAENRFNPTNFKPAELDAAVEKLAGVAQKAGLFSTTGSAAAYKKRLKDDADFRNEEWQKFRSQGKIEARVLAEGTQLVSNKYSFQKLERIKNGYRRIFDSGKTEYFNDAGRLVKLTDKNGNFIEFTYSKDGKLEKLQDNFHRRMAFKFNTQGLVESIDGENGKRAEYRYNSLGELVYSKDVDGNKYEYKYSADRQHNMVEVAYADKSTMQIAYFGADKQFNVRSVKERDGSVTDYTYDTDASDKGHFTVAANVKGTDGKMISTSKYEYFNKRKANGEEWLYKMVTVLDGDRTETSYNECCGLPLLIKRAGEETSFEYDSKGRVTRKTTPNEVTELAYDDKVGKVTKVAKYSKADKKLSNWSQFQYDTRGNLTLAKNSERKGVKLFYDNTGRIKTMVDQNQRQINFKYNENGKPVEIADPKLGAITVSYTNSGEIKKVESSAGRKVALEVTSAFQNLLDIIRPAGVTLSF